MEKFPIIKILDQLIFRNYNNKIKKILIIKNKNN